MLLKGDFECAKVVIARHNGKKKSIFFAHFCQVTIFVTIFYATKGPYPNPRLCFIR